MIVNTNGKAPRQVKGLTNEQMSDVSLYLKEKIDSWCGTEGTKPFAATDLVGGGWSGTPLQCIKDKHLTSKSESEAHKQASKELGLLLKLAVIEHEKEFVCTQQTVKGKDNINVYEWVG